MRKWSIICLLISVILAATAFADEIKVGAGTTAAATVLNPIKEHFEKATGIKLIILAFGTTNAVKDLDKGAVDAAMGAHDVPELVEIMKKEGYNLDRSTIKETNVEQPKKYLIVINKNNSVAKLTKEQAVDIFTGKIGNWKEVGGKDSPIIVVWGTQLNASNKHFVKTTLGGAAVTKDVLEVTNVADVKGAIESNLEAISYLPETMVSGGVRAPDAPVTKTKPINLFTKGEPSPNLLKLVSFIKGEGQKYISK